MAKKTYKTIEIVNNDKFTIAEIMGTPFSAIHDREKESYFLAIGNKVIYRNEFETLQDVFDIITAKPYDLLINISCMCAELVFNNLNSKNHD